MDPGMSGHAPKQPTVLDMCQQPTTWRAPEVAPDRVPRAERKHPIRARLELAEG